MSKTYERRHALENWQCKSVTILKDKWIPRPYTHMIQSPMIVLKDDAKVAKHNGNYLKRWKEILIHNMFSLEETKLIKSLPISFGESEDKLV